MPEIADAAKLRAWWSRKQGLDGGLTGLDAAEVLARTGWARSVGGVAPYLTLFARAGLRRATVDVALAAAQIHELPAARGCTHVLPAADYALGLAAGRDFSAVSEMKVAMKLGVTDAEIAALQTAVTQALLPGPLDPDALKTAVGPAARPLGPEGTKKGISNTLSVALGFLQQSGAIRRIPVNGRLDQQRYKYALWEPNPMAGWTLDQPATFTELARRYFQWTGPASLEEFQWFSGLGVKAAKVATAPLGLEPVADRWILPEDRDAFEGFRPPRAPEYTLVSSLDNISLLRRNFPSLLAPEDEQRVCSGRGRVVDLPSHAIMDRGRIAGFWEFDPASQAIVWMAFGKPDQALAEAVRRTEDFIAADLGDARSFILDTPKSREPKIAAIKRGELA
jgi:hypothetical protein